MRGCQNGRRCGVSRGSKQSGLSFCFVFKNRRGLFVGVIFRGGKPGSRIVGSLWFLDLIGRGEAARVGKGKATA